MPSSLPVPKHRAQPERKPNRPGGARKLVSPTPKRIVSRTALLSSLAAAATGVTVVGGVLSGSNAAPANLDLHEAIAAAKPLPKSVVARRAAPASRSDQRPAVDPTKAALFSAGRGGASTHTEDIQHQDPRSIAMALLPQFGFSTDQFGCLNSLYMSESGWRVNADNPSSSAYGIPQALPGSKMASAGADWATNPVTQITWGLEYIRSSYGSPCSAWGFKASHGWY